MSFDIHYRKRKDRRRPYSLIGSHDPGCNHACRPHGGCHKCRDNRLIATIRAEITAQEKLEEYHVA